MNKTTCPHISFDFTGRFLPPVYILVFIIGLTANVIGLKTLLQNWTKLKIINVFVLNLGLADILYLLTLPFLVVYHLKKNKWIFGDIFCKITRFCFNINLYGSIGFLTCISVSRYLAIVHPVRVMGRLTASHSVVASAIIWVLVSVQCLPDMFFAKTYRKGAEKCFDSTSNTYVEGYLKYSLAWTLTGFCLPFLITLGWTGKPLVKSPGLHTPGRRSLRLLLVLILLFSVCYIPYHVLRNLNLYSRVLSKRRQCYGWFDPVYVAQQVGRGLVCLNPALNPLVYLHVSEEISSGLRTLMGRTRSVLHTPTLHDVI
uniref:G-protein coupled receptors family 1 profile domain-containing protein n=1 Tax=Periophthalmus magnuspinnatus TaxID=409849 RepID=A0A3B3ZZW8_9GOBI